MLKTKRAYDKSEPGDGRRILVDRLWPRGVTKAAAGVDEWLKDLGPSTELRKWFGHQPEKWEEFKKRYIQELLEADKKALLEKIAGVARHSNVTLVYAAKDTEYNNAKVLADLIAKMQKKVPV
jgi:uncharacterized protein YeaO (DUF488 family)